MAKTKKKSPDNATSRYSRRYAKTRFMSDEETARFFKSAGIAPVTEEGLP